MKAFILSLLKYISLPIAVLYGIVVSIRNKMYDWNIFDSIGFSLPVISVGNITVGGTGKSPHIEYLLQLLKPNYQMATLSRGYRRASRGFRIANSQSNARDIGDEPFQFKSKYPQVEVCVAEERMTAIPQLLQQRPQVQVILLDDAFQHRTVKPGLSILLTDFDRRYTKDYIMPFGLLRESKSAAKRADIIIVSKCPYDLTLAQKQEIEAELAALPNQNVYFSAINYQSLYPLSQNEIQIHNPQSTVLLLTGIANPLPLQQYLQTKFALVHSLAFKDHHYFTHDDVSEIAEAFAHIKSENKIIITTEKDASRLMLLQDKIQSLKLPIFAQSIGIEILFQQQNQFDLQVKQFIETIIPPIVYASDSSNEDFPNTDWMQEPIDATIL